MTLFCFGTRPEWIKIKPILNKLNRQEYKLLFTGQHVDLIKDIDIDYKITMSESSVSLNKNVSKITFRKLK